MADFTALKAAINAAIKTNGEQEITGNILQTVLDAIVETLGDGAINDLITALNNEVTARQNADGTLQGNINAEATARGNADDTLDGKITAEKNARELADIGLQNAINAINTLLGEGAVYAGIATTSTNPGTPTGKVFYIATAAGEYTNFLDANSAALVLTQGINILKYNGTAWSVEQVIGIDVEPTAGSHGLVESGSVQNELALGAVYDVSAKNPTAGPNNDGKWESLSALFSDANLNTLIPVADRRGGMSIKYVQSSDNKYVQYRLMAQNFTTDVTQWQGIVGKPMAGSKYLVESDGIRSSIDEISSEALTKWLAVAVGSIVSPDGHINTSNTACIYTNFIKNDKSHIRAYITNPQNIPNGYHFVMKAQYYDDSKTAGTLYDWTDSNYINVNESSGYIRLSFRLLDENNTELVPFTIDTFVSLGIVIAKDNEFYAVNPSFVNGQIGKLSGVSLPTDKYYFGLGSIVSPDGHINTSNVKNIHTSFLPLQQVEEIHYIVSRPDNIPTGYHLLFKCAFYDNTDTMTNANDWTETDSVDALTTGATKLRAVFRLVNSGGTDISLFDPSIFSSLGIIVCIGDDSYLAINGDNSEKEESSYNIMQGTVDATADYTVNYNASCVSTEKLESRGSGSITIHVRHPENIPTGYHIDSKITFYDENGVYKKLINWGDSTRKYNDDSSGYIIVTFRLLDENSTAKSTFEPKELDSIGIDLELDDIIYSNRIVRNLPISYGIGSLVYPAGYVNPGNTSNVNTDLMPLYKSQLINIEIGNYDNLPTGYHLMMKAQYYASDGLTVSGVSDWQSDFRFNVGAVHDYVKIVFRLKDKNDNYLAELPLSIIEGLDIKIRIGDYTYCLNGTVEGNAENAEKESDTAKFIGRGGIVVCAWNIGHFAHGGAKNSYITEDNYDFYKEAYDKVVEEINPDLWSLSEYSSIFGPKNGTDMEAREVLFNQYPYAYIGNQVSYGCQAIDSFIPYTSVEKYDIESVETTHYYLVWNMVIKGKNVKFVSIHFQWDHESETTESEIAQFTEIVNKFQNDDYVIIAGDFNLKDMSSLSVFKNAGYTCANGGDFGEFRTFYNSGNMLNYKLDNIVSKGFLMSDVNVLYRDLSDHYPIYCKLMII